MLQIITKSRTNIRHKTVKLTFFIMLLFFISLAPYNIDHPFTDCEASIRVEYDAHYAS